MTNGQLVTLILTILGSNFAVLVYLSSRLDRVENFLAARIDRIGDKLDKINETLGRHDAEIENLKGVKK